MDIPCTGLAVGETLHDKELAELLPDNRILVLTSPLPLLGYLTYH
jgi:hypothetical protein